MFIINILNEKPLAEHALLKTIGAGNADRRILRTILANSRGLAAAIPTWMAALIERAPDSAIQILLTRQLDQELGRGSPDTRCGVKSDWLLSALKGVVDTIDADDSQLAPGRRWLEHSGRCFCDLSFAAAAGALVAAKYRSEELSAWLEIMLRRQGEDADTDTQYGWLEQHANRQAEHAADIENLLVITASDRERDEAAGGAEAFDARLWTYLDRMQRRQYERVAA